MSARDRTGGTRTSEGAGLPGGPAVGEPSAAEANAAIAGLARIDRAGPERLARRTEDPFAGFFYEPEAGGPEGVTAAVEAGPSAIVELLVFRLGAETFAVELSWVREIVRPPPITEVPRVADTVLGVISVRGEALPVFDLSKLLGLALAREAGARARRILILDAGQGPAGLDVDAVDQVVRMPRASVEPPPRGMADAKRAVALTGIGRLPGRLFSILDPGLLLDPARRA